MPLAEIVGMAMATTSMLVVMALAMGIGRPEASGMAGAGLSQMELPEVPKTYHSTTMHRRYFRRQIK
jgi:hypothetical protein